MVELAMATLPGPLGDLLFLRVDEQTRSGQLFKKLQGNDIGMTLAFTFVDLEEGIQESMTPNYADIDIVGRAEMFKVYTGAGNREIPITFRFQAQGIGGATDDVAAILKKEVRLPALWLDALKSPIRDLDSGISHAPPPCYLQVGQLFAERVIVTDANITWEHPFDPDTLLPFGATVPCTFTVVRSQIRNRNLELSSR